MSSRALTDAVAAAIVAGKVRPVVFVEGAFYDSGSPSESFLRLWSGLGDISWNSTTWTGAGQLLSISPLEESAEVKAVGFNVELSGLPQSILSTALANVRQGKPGKVWLGLMGREGYVDLPGSSGNRATTPDSAAVSITGNIDIRVKCALDDWTPAANAGLLSKWTGTGSQRSYEFVVTTGGLLSFRTSPDGTTAGNSSWNSSAATGFADGTTHWVRVTVNTGTGKANFYTSEDGDTWTLLGVEQTSTAAAIFNSTAQVSLGYRESGGAAYTAGDFYYAEILNGIAGTVVVTFDPSTDAHLGDTSFTSSTTGEVWTINQSGSTPARIAMDENHLLADPYLVRSGRMDYVNIVAAGETTRITAQYEDRLVDLERSRERRYTDEDQQFEYSGDLGFEFVAGLQDKQLIWGGPGAASSPVATPNYDNGGNDSSEDRRGNYSAYD